MSGTQLTLEILTLVVLTLTLVAVVWYTFETRRIQATMARQVDEMVIQRRLGVQPMLLLDFQSQGGNDADRLIIRNIGNGPALNVQVQPITNPSVVAGSFWTFARVPLILSGDESTPAYDEVTAGVSHTNSGDPFPHERSLIRLADERSENRFSIVVTFQNLEGCLLRQTIQLDHGRYVHGFVVPDPAAN